MGKKAFTYSIIMNTIFYSNQIDHIKEGMKAILKNVIFFFCQSKQRFHSNPFLQQR